MAGIFALASVVCFVIATLLGFGAFSGSHLLGWIAIGLTFLAAHFLVEPALTIVRRP